MHQHARMTRTPLHFAFLALAVAHTSAMLVVHAVAFAANAEARDFMLAVMRTAGVRTDALAVVAPDPDNSLLVCLSVPRSGEPEDLAAACRAVWTPANATMAFQPMRRALYPPSVTLAPAYNGSTFVGVTVTGLEDKPVWLSNKCTEVSHAGCVMQGTELSQTLRFPEQMLQDAQRENISLIFAELWILSISVLAVRLNASEPASCSH